MLLKRWNALKLFLKLEILMLSKCTPKIVNLPKILNFNREANDRLKVSDSVQ